jgi:hypothetical protein
VFDWECWWSHRTDVQPGPVDYPAIVADHHRALWERSITADFVQPLAALDRYRLVIAPALFRMSDEVEAWLTRFVESGGTLLLTHQSGIVDGDDRVRTGGYLAGLPLGMWVEEFDVQPKGRTLDVRTNDRKQFAGLEWRDVIRPTGAEVLAESPTPHFPGPVVTRHRFGSGHRLVPGNPTRRRRYRLAHRQAPVGRRSQTALSRPSRCRAGDPHRRNQPVPRPHQPRRLVPLELARGGRGPRLRGRGGLSLASMMTRSGTRESSSRGLSTPLPRSFLTGAPSPTPWGTKLLRRRRS